MNSLEALKMDFNSQVQQLSIIKNERMFDDCIYVGSGDSYVAGLIAEYLTNHKCRCYSPSDLLNSRLLKDKTFCFISVTGKTSANIRLAQLARESGIKTIAVTIDRSSQLAQTCKEIIPLKIKRTSTPNFGTFAANVITCLQIAGLNIPNDFEIWHKKGVQLSHNLLQSLLLPNDGSIYILGKNILFAVCLYASFKIVEFFGNTAFAHKLEEFCHSPIFGLNRSDQVWILGQNEMHISQSFEKIGIPVTYFELYDSDMLTQLFTSIFCVQNLILLLAARHRFTEPRYLVDKAKLKTSSDLIY